MNYVLDVHNIIHGKLIIYNFFFFFFFHLCYILSGVNIYMIIQVCHEGHLYCKRKPIASTRFCVYIWWLGFILSWCFLWSFSWVNESSGFDFRYSFYILGSLTHPLFDLVRYLLLFKFPFFINITFIISYINKLQVNYSNFIGVYKWQCILEISSWLSRLVFACRLWSNCLV